MDAKEFNAMEVELKKRETDRIFYRAEDKLNEAKEALLRYYQNVLEGEEGKECFEREVEPFLQAVRNNLFDLEASASEQ